MSQIAQAEGAMMEDESRDDDFKLLEHYQKFSAEVVRISLLAIGAIGGLYTLKSADRPTGLDDGAAKFWFVVSLVAFGIAVAFALWHRYWSTDFMASTVQLQRLRTRPPQHKTSDEVKTEIVKVTASRKCASRLAIWTAWVVQPSWQSERFA